MRRVWIFSLALCLGWSAPLGAVVINEIHYHPASGDGAADDALEFIELANDTATPEDLSGYAFVEGVAFVFPPGTILPGRGFLVVAADANAVKARYGIANVAGNYTGLLDNSNDRLTLVNHAGSPVQSMRYRDGGEWPVAPDGTGHTLVLRTVHLDSSEPENWAASPRLGGSPGKANFPSAADEVIVRTVVPSGAVWRYREGTAPFSAPVSAWHEPDFNDAAWSTGPSGFGYRVGTEGTIAYQVPSSTVGNQDFPGSLGMDFNVTQAIEVTQLGVFDSGQDGLSLPITARLYNRATGVALAELEFTPGEPGDLIEGSRIKDLSTPITLAAGFQGTVVAAGYGGGEPNGNQGISSLGLTTEGAGRISFVGGGRFGATAGEFPASIDGGPADRYAAGTFIFSEPGAPPGEVNAPNGAGTLLSELPGNGTSVAARVRFSLTDEELFRNGEFLLEVEFDDGFCAFLNGVEVARANCGIVGTEPAWDGVAPVPHGAGTAQFFPIPAALVTNDNVLALIGYSTALDDRQLVLTPRVLFRESLATPGGGRPIVFNELRRGGRRRCG